MFSKLAKAFKPSGVKIVLQPPRSFNWGEQSLPVTAELTNRDEQPLTVEAITYQLREKEEDESTLGERDWARKATVTFTHELNLTLPPGHTTRVDTVIPVSMEQQAGEDSPEWMKFAGKAMDFVQRSKSGTNKYALRAAVDVTGEKKPKTTVKDIMGSSTFGTTWRGNR